MVRVIYFKVTWLATLIPHPLNPLTVVPGLGFDQIIHEKEAWVNTFRILPKIIVAPGQSNIFLQL